MNVFDKKAVERACSEAQICRDYPEYFIMKYLLIKPKKTVGNYDKSTTERYSHMDVETIKKFFTYFRVKQ